MKVLDSNASSKVINMNKNSIPCEDLSDNKLSRGKNKSGY